MRSFGQGRIIEDSNGCERYHGPTSFVFLVSELSETTLPSIGKSGFESQGLAQAAGVAREKITFLLSEEEPSELLQDGSPPSSPPLAILEAMIDQYFDKINCYFPIWTKKSFRQLVETSYKTKPHVQDRAHVVSFNNLILLSLSAKSLQSRAKKAADLTSSRPVEFDLTGSFLANVKRALVNLELLTAPRLINVQALLSLCLVAQEYLTPNKFLLLFNLATQVAKSIGLHHWDSNGSRSARNDAEERRNVFQCLFILDKAVSWTGGWSPILQLSNASPAPPTSELLDETSAHLKARFKLAEIEEEIYLNLYCPHNETNLRKLAAASENKLQKWWTEFGSDLENDEDPSCGDFSRCSKLELAVSYHSTRITLTWPFHNDTDDVLGRILDDARSCLTLFLTLWNATSELGHYAHLAR
ncbi:hypothetical protein K402DRAFT_325548 [Aulographum hederae CBS 113979]|uniref:Xylanolytic transcriptional activator regulatory domain-containing protein n=1 Tax=Aulographum hederae CBS 113979 TaxID=1176131 RepID=A0A6G1HAA1_9PEZI|nr:hypothetical protein K402DRAFT_325548 [Aulographum hederae CBS 113979]